MRVVPGARPDPGAAFKIASDRSTITTSALQMTIRHDPFRIAIADAQGNSLDEDDPQNGIAFSGSTVRVWKRLRDDEQVYGLGSKTGDFNKRGRKLGGYNYTMWNSDTLRVRPRVPIRSTCRCRSSSCSAAAAATASFSTTRSAATSTSVTSRQGLLSFGADGGELNYYFINGPDPKSVITRYTALTGRMPLPPRWALGYHQCRYSYYPDSKVRFIAQNFRERRIPADVIWLDIHYLEGFNPFTWDRSAVSGPTRPHRRPPPARAAARYVIVDPHPKKAPGWASVRFGTRRRSLREEPGRQRLRSAGMARRRRKRIRGRASFPDFSKPAAREWWGGLFAALLKAGVAGIWNDMNEPAIFDTPTARCP